MNVLTLFGELFPVLGTIGLLGLWLYQQTGIESRSNEMRRLSGARGVYQTYQSHNAVFNAINEVLGDNQKASRQLRVFQTYNYELGLGAIEESLPEADREGIPAAPNAYDTAQQVETKMAATQKRLEHLQTKLADREQIVRQASEAAKKRYLWAYVLLSAVSIVGAVCKTIDKLMVHPQ